MESRFRFNLSLESAIVLLTASYKVEVERRQREFSLDDDADAQ